MRVAHALQQPYSHRLKGNVVKKRHKGDGKNPFFGLNASRIVEKYDFFASVKTGFWRKSFFFTLVHFVTRWRHWQFDKQSPVCVFSQLLNHALAWKKGLNDQQRPFFMHFLMSNIFVSITNKYLYVCKVSNFLTLIFQSIGKTEFLIPARVARRDPVDGPTRMQRYPPDQQLRSRLQV